MSGRLNEQSSTEQPTLLSHSLPLIHWVTDISSRYLLKLLRWCEGDTCLFAGNFPIGHISNYERTCELQLARATIPCRGRHLWCQPVIDTFLAGAKWIKSHLNHHVTPLWQATRVHGNLLAIAPEWLKPLLNAFDCLVTLHSWMVVGE